jgi:calcineurin-like phosphoesterase family protein
MRPVRWLHITDFHLRESTAWAQDVVLTALCEDVDRRRSESGDFDFVLATGDLAFGGKAPEYELVGSFFDKIAGVANVSRDRIFCVPGNHDVNRTRQTTCFAGARHILKSQSDVDALLGEPEEMATLLQRQENYSHFQEKYFAEQERQPICGGLAYVSSLTIDHLKFAIVGLNTAWLAEGGVEDHSRLVAGERQIIDAFYAARAAKPHIVIAMGHHPLFLLNEFDRILVQRRVEEVCHFYHCGHLHELETREVVGSQVHCLTVAAGSSFESRESQNAYSIINLDVVAGKRNVTTIRYDAGNGSFSLPESETRPLTLKAAATLNLGELGEAISCLADANLRWSYHLAALLTGAHEELAVELDNGPVFATLSILEKQTHGVLKESSVAFLSLRNPLRLFAGDMAVGEFVAKYCDSINAYSSALETLVDENASFVGELDRRDANARALAGNQKGGSFANMRALMDELTQDQDWSELSRVARRALSSENSEIVVTAKRYLARSLAHSEDASDHLEARELFAELFDEGIASSEDAGAYVSILIGDNAHEDAKTVLRRVVATFPNIIASSVALGREIVMATGDLQFRDEVDEWARRGNML